MVQFDRKYKNLSKVYRTFFAPPFTVIEKIAFHIFNLKMKVKVHECEIQSGAIRWHIKIYKNGFLHFFGASAHSFRDINISNVGQGRGLHLSWWRHSMVNVKIYKSHFLHFYFR